MRVCVRGRRGGSKHGLHTFKALTRAMRLSNRVRFFWVARDSDVVMAQRIRPKGDTTSTAVYGSSVFSLSPVANACRGRGSGLSAAATASAWRWAARSSAFISSGAWGVGVCWVCWVCWVCVCVLYFVFCVYCAVCIQTAENA